MKGYAVTFPCVDQRMMKGLERESNRTGILYGPQNSWRQ